MTEFHPEFNDIVVFSILHESSCSECGIALTKGTFLRKEDERVLCLDCADLAHLVWLSRGDAALTRRATRYSALHAVEVQFSRSRGRYERQGVLVEEAAVVRAEEECLSDADARACARERAAVRRAALDAGYVDAFAMRIADLYPACPDDERRTIAKHACQKYSGRVGRSAAAKALDATAVDLAVRAHVRHAHTPYDRLLERGRDRSEARAEIRGDLDKVLARWKRH